MEHAFFVHEARRHVAFAVRFQRLLQRFAHAARLDFFSSDVEKRVARVSVRHENDIGRTVFVEPYALDVSIARHFVHPAMHDWICFCHFVLSAPLSHADGLRAFAFAL